MTIFTVEKILYEVASSPERAQQYKAERSTFLGRFPLAADEAQLILDLDVSEIIRRGVNPMLAMRAFQAIEGRDSMPEYFRRLREA